MALSAWSEAVPSGTSLVGQFPIYGRSVFVAISGGMAVEHSWPASGGGSDASAGDLLPGASRAFVAVQSASSAPLQATGRLFLASDTSRLLVYDSAGTYLGGTPFLGEHVTDAGTGMWMRQAGSFSAAGNVTQSTAFPVPYMAPPVVTLTGSSFSYLVSIITVTSSQFTWHSSNLLGAPATNIIYWVSLGTVSSASY